MNQSILKKCAIIFLNGILNLSLASENDNQQLIGTLKKIFDKPTAPLTVDAIAVSGNFSLASWSQEPKAGRALLRKRNNQWEIVVCGGKDLKKITALEKAGVPSNDAQLLVSDLSKEELRLPVSLQKQIDSFSLGNQKIHNSHH